MNETTKRSKPFTLLLSESEYRDLLRRASERTLAHGRRVSIGDVLREAAFGDQRATEPSLEPA